MRLKRRVPYILAQSFRVVSYAFKSIFTTFIDSANTFVHNNLMHLYLVLDCCTRSFVLLALQPEQGRTTSSRDFSNKYNLSKLDRNNSWRSWAYIAGKWGFPIFILFWVGYPSYIRKAAQFSYNTYRKENK